MRDISEINKAFDEYIKRLTEKSVKAQQHATEYMLEESKQRIEIPQEARNTQQFVDYSNSIKIKKAELEKNEIKSSVYSDLVIKDGSKWDGVPVGAFLEWGTGPLGKESHIYEHGYDYTTISPWDYHTWLQLQQTGNWGITARPHLYPAFLHTHSILIANIKEAIQESWT